MPRSIRRTSQALAVLLGVAAVAVPAAAQDLGGQQAAAGRLQAAVAAESARIATTRDGLADAQARLATLQSRVDARQADLERTRDDLVRARVRLTKLQKREAQATRTLSDNLVASYKTGRPDLVTVVFSSTGFGDLFERLEFLKRSAESNGRLLDDTRKARADVAAETRQLEQLRIRFSAMARDAIADRNRADVIRNALLDREAAQLAKLNSSSSRLATVKANIRTIQRRQAAAARALAASQSAANDAPAPTPTGDPSGVISRVVAAANQIATTPYVWGGGHGGASGGYDCSGSVSYALAAGGLLASPLDSTGFMSWGAPGPGAHITVYANAGHAYMVVDGRRYDTSALSGGGTRWTSEMRSSAGFVARHPPGF
jgi:cell wall-associated NlpC family hydrolase